MYQLAKPMYGAIELARARMAMECHTYSSGCMHAQISNTLLFMYPLPNKNYTNIK